MSSKTLVCDICGKFATGIIDCTRGKRYCDAACYLKDNVVPEKCDSCHKPLESMNIIDSVRGKKYCNSDCYNKDNSPEAIIADIGNRPIKRTIECIENNPKFFQQTHIKMVLGYYLSEYECNLHAKNTSVVVLGILLRIPKMLIVRTLKRHLNYEKIGSFSTKWLDSYETKQFDKNQFLRECVPLITTEYDEILRGYILAHFSLKELVELRSPLVSENSTTVLAITNIIDGTV